MQPPPPFDDAVSTFRNFLTSQKMSDSLRWIWRDTIISRRGAGTRRTATRPIYIDEARVADESEIRDYYQLGVDRNLGIALAVFCIVDGQPYCYVDLPEDATDAEYKLMGPLKCAIPDPTPVATLIRFRWRAALMRIFTRIPPTAWITNNVPLRPAA